MDATAAPVAGTNGAGSFGIGRLFFSDSRLAFALLNEGRHRALHSVFGVSRENENVLTFVLAIGAMSAAYEAAARLPVPHVSGRDCVTGALMLRQGAAGVAGPAAAATPMFGTLMVFAVVGGVALPGLRRAAHAARAAEHRARQNRIARYVMAGRSARESEPAAA